jgi:CDP-diacylglycerol--glycerol-3-phosphate 3-phosphatidyltransferase
VPGPETTTTSGPDGPGGPDGVVERMFGPTALATPANAVTVARIVGSFGLGFLVVAGVYDWALVVFIVLALSDNIDGVLARRQGPTRSGAFLDPLADKFLVGVALVALSWRGEIGWWFPVLILSREFVISLYRSIAARNGVSVPASWLGKAKTFVTMIAIGMLLVPGGSVRSAGVVVLWVGVVLTWVSAVDYLWRARHATADSAGVPADAPLEAGGER